jgi:hypothetical protein
LAQFTLAPTQTHWSLVKHLLWFLQGHSDIWCAFLQEFFGKWTNKDYTSSLVLKKSTSGYVITFFGNPVLWMTKKQPVVAQSTTEAEFIAINKCAQQLCWISNLIISLLIKIDISIIFNNNSSAVIITKEPKLNPNTKHIKICFQYIRQLMGDKVTKFKQVLTVDMIADVFTKPLGKIKLAITYKQLIHSTNVHV